ncbi:hypothetical protein GMRT_13564 [Giardia muris]|uniref:Uncharacterized protein n=1 Tax=Giardia muris TaxID=5742 RepID=A0A4Z1SW32_GIAMU|nr:hypothetical protein GMRT_13564 [Giardia muris]|eukprot:TNJ29984.1 hypothetical protein GMRT_13564 [Giardia muris]
MSLFEDFEHRDKVISTSRDTHQPAFRQDADRPTNEIPSAPPFKAKVSNMVGATAEDLRSIIEEEGYKVVEIVGETDFIVEVESADALRFILTFNGVKYQEDAKDVPPIKVRIYSYSRPNPKQVLTSFTRAACHAVEAASSGPWQSGTAFDRSAFGSGVVAAEAVPQISRSDFSKGGAIDVPSSQGNVGLNFRSQARPQCAAQTSSGATGLSGLAGLRSGTLQATIGTHDPEAKPTTGIYQFRQRESTKEKDSDGWTLNQATNDISQ